MTLDELSKKFNKEFRDSNFSIISDCVPEYERMPTNALGLDYILAGGIPLGRIIEFSGQMHSGKTTAACVVMAAYQRKFPEKKCVYVDVEHTLDLKFQSKMTGLDLSNMYYINPTPGQSGEEILDVISELAQADDCGLIVLDSIPSLIPHTVLENSFTKDSGMRATTAKTLYPFFNKIQSIISKTNNIFIVINQVRDAGKTFTGVQMYKEPGGGAPQFYCSMILRFGTRRYTLKDDMDACKMNNGEGADGFRLQFKVLKNKCGASNRGGGFITFRYATGLDWMQDLLDIALHFNFIKRLNNITYALINLDTGEIYKDKEGKDLVGKKAYLVSYIENNIDFQNEYLAMLNRNICDSQKSYGSLLDERAEKEIDDQENSISNSNLSEENKTE